MGMFFMGSSDKKPSGVQIREYKNTKDAARYQLVIKRGDDEVIIGHLALLDLMALSRDIATAVQAEDDAVNHTVGDNAIADAVARCYHDKGWSHASELKRGDEFTWRENRQNYRVKDIIAGLVYATCLDEVGKGTMVRLNPDAWVHIG